MTPQAAKARMRAEIRARLRQLATADRAAGSSLICQRIVNQDFWKTAKTVLLFAPMPDEVNIWPLLVEALAAGKVLCLPRYDSVKKIYTAAQVKDLELDLVAAAFDIQEPAGHCGEIPLADIDLALVPGVGFDLKGNRLGRGKGFYDRLLAGFGGIKCGVAWEEQMAETIPAEEQDVRMDLVWTPTQVFGGQNIGGNKRMLISTLLGPGTGTLRGLGNMP